MVDSKEETIVFSDETRENETSICYPQCSTEGKEVVKSLSPDENNPLDIPEESASTAVFYQQYNEATIGKSEDTVSEPIQDSDFNDPSHMGNTIVPDEGNCNADTCIEKNISANRKENGKEVLSEPHGCLDGNKESDDISSCRSIHVAETLFENVPQQHTLPQLISSGSEMCIGLQETTNITSDKTEDQLKKEEIFCDPCLHGDLKSKATIFCKTCDVPEPLCADCAVQHTRHKLCRNHELCDNMAEFIIKRVPFKPKYNAKFQENCKQIIKIWYLQQKKTIPALG